VAHRFEAEWRIWILKFGFLTFRLILVPGFSITRGNALTSRTRRKPMDNDAFEFDDRRVLAEGSVRLHAALSALGSVNVPAASALCDSLCEWYELQDLQLARALTAPTASLDWHLVSIGPAGEPLLSVLDVLTIAPSLARAFAGLQIEMDRARMFPARCDAPNSAFPFWRAVAASSHRSSPSPLRLPTCKSASA
jgi:hypothetical protein